MKNILFLALAIGAVATINACCKKQDCTSANEHSSIHFYNFSQNEMDTISIMSYVKESNLTTVLDSITMVPSGSGSGDMHYVYLKEAINIERDYKIVLKQTGQVYTLTAFQIQEIKCKEGCGLSFLKKGRNFDRLIGYDVNGRYQAASEIAIYK